MRALAALIAAASWVGGTIVAVVVAVLVGLAIVVTTLWLLYRRLRPGRGAASRSRDRKR